MKHIILIILITFSIFASAQNWTSLTVPTPRNLYGCWFDSSHPDTGMAVGWYIQNFDRLPFGFFTTNGGSTITSGSLFQVYFYASSDVWFTNSYSGIVVGNGIIQTTDGGANWNLIVDAASTQAGILENVMFTNGTNGYAVGQRYDFSYTSLEGMIYKTSNAGGSWTDYTISQEINNENTQMHAIYSTGNGIVYAGAENTLGGSTLFKSTDDGITWSPLNFYQSIWSLFFTSADTGFAATANGLYKTIDAGINWATILPTINSLHTIQIKNGFGFTAGENGVIYVTNNNGNSWTLILSPVNNTINDVSIISSNLAYAVGTSGTFLKYTNTVGINDFNYTMTLSSWLDANNQLNIKLKKETESPVLIQLVNTNGIVVKKSLPKQQASDIQNVQMDVSSLPDGVYLLRVLTEEKITNKKIILIKNKS